MARKCLLLVTLLILSTELTFATTPLQLSFLKDPNMRQVMANEIDAIYNLISHSSAPSNLEFEHKFVAGREARYGYQIMFKIQNSQKEQTLCQTAIYFDYLDRTPTSAFFFVETTGCFSSKNGHQVFPDRTYKTSKTGQRIFSK